MEHKKCLEYNFILKYLILLHNLLKILTNNKIERTWNYFYKKTRNVKMVVGVYVGLVWINKILHKLFKV